MLAIHNSSKCFDFKEHAANAFAKLSKCQQFTTPFWFKALYQGCKRFCKVIKMLAIHNLLLLLHCKRLAANAFAKLSKCQQFTTTINYQQFRHVLQTLLQSYQNVSNSQPSSSSSCSQTSCKRFCKVIKMLAIHNDIWLP